MIGRRLAHYRITAPLGAGGMGAVYRATDTKLDREVALKVLPNEMASQPVRRERFRREAKALAALDHPGIVGVYSVEEAEGVHFLTMQLVEGQPLDQLIPAGGLPVERILDAATALADALAAAHEKGVVHRDLKPANVMLTKGGRVKVLDFGLAKMSGIEASSSSALSTEAHTREGVVMGTVPYMSPEQVQGRVVDHRTDLYSLGVMLYEMATGRRPFRSDSAAGLMSAILRDTPESPGSLRADLPEALRRVIERCLAKDPAERFQSARDVHAALTAKRPTASPIVAAGSPAGGRDRRPVSSPGGAEISRIAALPLKSIAVLPFLSLDEKQQVDYLCVGIADEIISALGRLPGVRVVSRTSSFRFKGAAPDARELGRLLGVELIVEGSVRRVQNRFRVTAQLVSARDGCCIQSQRYDCGDEDVFDMQESIARDFAAALQVQRVEGDAAFILRDTRNAAAYHMYLRARHAWYHRHAGGIQRAIDYFQRAAELDPAYISAHAGLADCHVILGTYGFLPPAVSHRQALAAAEKALSLDAEHPAALGSRAAVHFYYEWNWPEAERKLRRAVELAPEIVELRTTYGLLLTFLKRREAAMSNMRSALGIDPLSPYANSAAALNHLLWGEAELAKIHCDRALEVEADFLLAWIIRAAAMAKSGEHGGAIALMERLADRSERASYVLGWLGWALACGGEREKAESVRRELVARRAVAYVPSVFIAWVEAALGEREEARKNLALAVKERHPMLIAHALPVFDPLWADPLARSLLEPYFPK